MTELSHSDPPISQACTENGDLSELSVDSSTRPLLLPAHPALGLFGPPASGKDTQAEFLAQRLGIPLIPSGALLRDNVQRGTPLGLKVAPYVSSKDLVPDELVTGMISERIHQPDCAKGFILVGFPRTLQQAEDLEKILTELGLGKLILVSLAVDDASLLKRMEHRLATSKEKRADDTPEVFLGRIDTFRRETLPVFDLYQRKDQLVVIDGNGSIEETRSLIDARLKKNEEH